MFKALKMLKIAKDPRNYRWFYTSEGKLVIGGKNEDQNEYVLKYFLKSEYTVMHTSSPGSPFMIIQNSSPSKKDLDECAVFCASFSKEWKKLKNSRGKIDIDFFKGNQIYKTKDMKTGTFGIKGKKKTMKVKPELMLIIQKGKLRAVPKTKTKEQILGLIKPGKLSKEEAGGKIAKDIRDNYHLPISKDEVMQAIPSDKIGVSKK